MATTIIANATIVTGDPGRTIHHDGALAVQDDLIAAVGPTPEVMAQHPDAEVISGAGRAVFPGIVNCHAHLTAVINRGITEDFDFPTRLRFPMGVIDLLSEEETKTIAALGAIECIRTGNTTVLEIAGGIDVYAQEVAGAGLRLALAETTADGVTGPGFRPGEAVTDFSEALRDESLERATRLFEKWQGKEDGRITCFGSAQLVETSSPDLLRQVRDLAERYQTGYTIHLAQSRLEVESLMRTRGVRPTHYLFAHDFLGPGLVAAHCRYLDPSEIAVLGTTGTAVSHQPAMAARRAVIPPIPALRAAGCTVGLGTDNNSQDMVEVMRAALFTERILLQDATRPQPEDILEWATLRGATALGTKDTIGSLEVGKKADLFVVNTQRAHLVPTMRIVSAFVHNGQPGDIESVMVDGKFLMRDGQLLTLDEAAIVAEADRIGRRAWNRLVERYPNVPFPLSLAPG